MIEKDRERRGTIPATSVPTGDTAFRVFDACTLVSTKAPERLFHVDPYLPSGDVTLLSGDGGTGKSLLALQLAVATVTGGKWCGSKVTQGGVLYLSAEDSVDEIHRRLEAVVRHERLRDEQLQGFRIVSLAGKDALLAVPKQGKSVLSPTPLYDDLEKLIAEHRPKLLVIDTLADVFGGSEIDRAHARQFVGLLRRWALEFDCSVLLLSHPSLSGLSSGSGTSGSTAWSNSVRSRLYLDRDSADGESDPNTRTLRVQKSNYGPIGEKIRLRWHDGVFSSANAAQQTVVESAANARAENHFMKLLAEFAAEGRNVSPHPNAPTFAPSAFAKDARRNGIRKQGFEAAMERLFEKKAIRIEKSSDAPSRRKDIIVSCSAPA